MLLGKSRSVRRRVAVIVGATAAITAIGAGVPWLGARFGLWGWPASSSWYGVLLGVIGGLIVLFEMALWPRKLLRRYKLGRTKYWMRLHIWLGLVCLPVILVHTGFGFGGPLPALTLVLFLLVIISGVGGLLLQQWLPEKILDEVPSETIAAEIDFVSSVHVAEAESLIESLLTAPPEYDERESRRPLAAGGVLLVLRDEPALAGLPAKELIAFRDSLLAPFLKGDVNEGSPLHSRTEAERSFSQLRDTLPEAAGPVVDRLEEIADLRRQWNRQARLNWWLHSWLIVHLPLSVAMTGFMLVHAVRALKYW